MQQCLGGGWEGETGGSNAGHSNQDSFLAEVKLQFGESGDARLLAAGQKMCGMKASGYSFDAIVHSLMTQSQVNESGAQDLVGTALHWLCN
jgi:hypothetical protein